MTSPLPVLTVLVVDDQAPFRFAVKAVLRRLPCFQLAGEAKSGPEAITLVDEVHPALVLMDINMPEMNGIEATRRIVAAHPDVVVFLCSTHDVTDLPPGAPTSGARAYINKEHFGADALRQLWHNRDSTPFARLLPRPRPPRSVIPRPAPANPARPRLAPRIPAPRPQAAPHLHHPPLTHRANPARTTSVSH
ncbi:MAG TPA: response regulator transcription factor [Streptosporangiaceae bacterium]|nr:response regulator transcription factor [Streptosporangiaceae bacterium]